MIPASSGRWGGTQKHTRKKKPHECCCCCTNHSGGHHSAQDSGGTHVSYSGHVWRCQFRAHGARSYNHRRNPSAQSNVTCCCCFPIGQFSNFPICQFFFQFFPPCVWRKLGETRVSDWDLSDPATLQLARCPPAQQHQQHEYARRI